MNKRVCGFVLAFAVYFSLFMFQENRYPGRGDAFSAPLPYEIQKTALGYIHQLGAELLYIKTVVFTGGDGMRQAPEIHEENLANHLLLVSKIHPEFSDTYYITQGYLARLSEESAIRSNEILQNGMKASPQNWNYPFFYGFNLYYYLHEPIHAADVLRRAARSNPEAPGILEHLAAVLSAKGGDIQTALSWLKIMYSGESDEMVRERYSREIEVYEKALSIKEMTDKYRLKYGGYPETLQDITPEFIDEIPDMGNMVLVWEPPVLRLVGDGAKGREKSDRKA